MQTLNNQPFHVLIAAAGSGTRTGAGTPKQYIKIGDKTVLQHTINIFKSHPSCASINVIIGSNDPKPDHVDTIIAGGETRKQSIYNGLKTLSIIKNEDIILIHDAARPYLHAHDIDQILTAMQTHKAATLCKSVSDTLSKTDNTRINRDDLFALQTPQAFRYGDIMAAHEATKDDNSATDDTLLLAQRGEKIHFIQSKYMNDKITTAADLTMAHKLLSPNTETRTGTGYDVHAFDDTKDHVMLCGIKIPHDKGLKGHSDADVALHTITDALLGAIAQGDIGRHFPPSDPAFKNMDSAIFLEKARDLITEIGGHIINIDITIICEDPKITPHAPAMITNVATILGINENRVSIKATTSEKLGFTGRGEGIAAMGVATVKVPADE